MDSEEGLSNSALEAGRRPRQIVQDRETVDSASPTSPWSGDIAIGFSASIQASHERYEHDAPYIQHPSEESRHSYVHHDPSLGTVPFLSGQVLDPAGMINPSQFAVPQHLGVPAEQAVYNEPPLYFATTARPASVPLQEGSWQGCTNSLYANPYASNLLHHNSTPYVLDVSGNPVQPARRLAPKPHDSPDRFLDHRSQYIGDYSTPDPRHLQAQRSPLSRRRSAPEWAMTPATAELTMPVDYSGHQLDSSSSQLHLSTGTSSILKASASQTGVPWEGYQCLQCNKVLQDERGLKRHALTHSKDFALSHICEECEAAFQFEKDLIRHTLTHNEDPTVRKYKCPSHSCNYASKGFKRKDHFKRHVRRQHGMDPTPYMAQYR